MTVQGKMLPQTKQNRQFSITGNKRRQHDRQLAVALVFNSTRSHDAGNAAAGADKHWDKRFTGKPELTENAIHNKRNPRHITAVFQEGQEQEQQHYLWYKTEYGANTANNTI